MFRPSRTLPLQLLRQAARLRPIDLPAPYLNSFRCIRQNTTSASASDAAVTFASQSHSRWTRRLLYIGIFGGLGLYAGKAAVNTVSAPSVPGTDEDAREMKKIQEAVNLLPIVRKLRDDPNYVEWEPYTKIPEEEREHRLTSGPLKGSRGLAVQVSSTVARFQSLSELDLGIVCCGLISFLANPWIASRGLSGTKKTRKL